MEFVQGRIEHQHHRSRDVNHPIALARIIKNGQEKKWMSNTMCCGAVVA